MYDISESTVRRELRLLGVRWVNVPGIGFRVYRPDIDQLHWKALTPLARRMHEEQQAPITDTKRRVRHATQGT